MESSTHHRGCVKSELNFVDVLTESLCESKIKSAVHSLGFIGKKYTKFNEWNSVRLS